MALLAALGALCSLLQGGAQLPASLLEAPVPTAPSASCAPGVPANQCLAAPTADSSGETDDEHAAGQVLLSMDELVFFVRDVASFSPAADSSKRYLPIVQAALEEVQELVIIAALEELEEELIPPSVTSHLLFKHWCRRELSRNAAATLCPRYLDRLKTSEGGAVWHQVHEQLQPAVAFLNRLVDVWAMRFKRQRMQKHGPAGDARSPLRVVINGGGPAGLVNAVTAYTAGAEVILLEKRPSYRRSVWFDLTSSQHILRTWDIFSPAQDILAAFGWEEQDTHEKHSGNAGIIHVQCAELERFLSKVLHFLGVTVLGQRHGLGLCLAPAAAQHVTGETWGWVSAPADQAAKYSSLVPRDLCSSLSVPSTASNGTDGWNLPDDWVADVLTEGELKGTEFFYRRSNPTEVLWYASILLPTWAQVSILLLYPGVPWRLDLRDAPTVKCSVAHRGCTLTESDCDREPPSGATRASSVAANASLLRPLDKNDDMVWLGDYSWQAPNGLMLHKVDLLIGADGSHSVVRGAVGVDFEPQDTLVLPESAREGRAVAEEAQQRHSLRLDALSQTTLIAKFLQVPKTAKQSAVSSKRFAAESRAGEGVDFTALRCPPTRVVDERPRREVVGTGLIDPFYPGLVIDGVTSVFKRFFNDECELQVLLSDDFASSLWGDRTDASVSMDQLAREEDRAEARAWEKLLEVANLLIVPHSNTSSTRISPAGAKQTGGLNDGGMRAGDVAYPSVEALKVALTPPGGQPPKLLGVAGGSDTAQHPTEVGDVRTSDKAAAAAAQHTAVGAGLFRIQINLARTLAGTVSESVLAEQLQLSKTGGTPTRPMFALVGDAAVTAHYRLGVGVNHAFANVRDLSNLVRTLSPPGAEPLSERLTTAAITQHNEALSKRAVNLVQFQLFAMYFEAHCGLVVIKDQLYRHDRQTGGDMQRMRSAALEMDECQRRRGESERSRPR